MTLSVQPHTPRWRRLRLAATATLLIPVVVVGIISATVAFFVAARLSSSMAGLKLAALTACVLTTCALALPLARRLAPARYGRMTLLVGGVAVVVTVLLSAQTIFQPLAPLRHQASLPEGGGYWDLPTGSRVAYLHIASVGAPKATPIIFVHGGPGAYAVSLTRYGASYYGYLNQDGYDVYVYDQIGSGLSARLPNPSEYTVERHIEDLEAIRRKTGAEQVILLGSSWGATLVANYMAAHPQHVAKAVFTSPWAIYPFEWSDFASPAAMLPAEEQEQIQNLRGQPRLMAWSILRGINPEAAHSFLPERELDSMGDQNAGVMAAALVCDPARMAEREAPSGMGFWSHFMTGNDVRTRRMDPRAMLADNQTPVLILKGECDFSRWELAEQYRTALPNATLLHVPGAGHAIWIERPDIYHAAIRAFVLGQPLAAALQTVSMPSGPPPF